MSGIIAILHEDGRPVDEELLWSLTNYMRYRGPDEQRVWCQGQVGLGHAMLRTTYEMEHETQPSTHDGEIWIAADARIDDRENLRKELGSKGHKLQDTVTDVDLILCAYREWGRQCLDHLIGDFAFALWDNRRQDLFCARDHFGIKPLFYVHKDGTVLVSNTLNCLRLHPAVSSELHEDSIRSFLTRGFVADQHSTVFKDIRRLPAAYSLACSQDAFQIRRYWSVPIEEPLRYKDPIQYIEEFSYLMAAAVNDRLRTSHVSVKMSGGLDSTSVAAFAATVVPERFGQTSAIKAYTAVSSEPGYYDEGEFAALTANHVGIDIEYLVSNLDFRYFEHWYDSSWNTPEPRTKLASLEGLKFEWPISRYSRVTLTGYGGDVILYPSRSYLLDLLNSWRLRQLYSDVSMYYRYKRRLPPPYIRTALRNILSEWKGNLKYGRKHRTTEGERRNKNSHSQITVPAEKAKVHPWRQEAIDRLDSSWWSMFLEEYDPGETGTLLEYRHPFFDRRLVEFSLRLPAVPWCVDKLILRRATSGLLPASITGRPKARVPIGFLEEFLRPKIDEEWVGLIRSVPGIARYVNIDIAVSKILNYSNEQGSYLGTDPNLLFHPFILAYWLKNLDSFMVFTPTGESALEDQSDIGQVKKNEKRISYSGNASLWQSRSANEDEPNSTAKQ